MFISKPVFVSTHSINAYYAVHNVARYCTLYVFLNVLFFFFFSFLWMHCVQ